MKKEFGIYCIENLVNNKKYVGQSVDVSARFSHHKCLLNKNIHDNKHLQNAWNKYGEENFIFYIVEACEECFLDEREKYWINFYKKELSAYNILDGGIKPPSRKGVHWNKEQREAISRRQTGEKSCNWGKKLSKETRERMSNSLTGRELTEEHKRNISLGMTGRRLSEEHKENLSKSKMGENNPSFGKLLSDEIKEKISIATSGDKNHNYGKKMSEETKNKISNSLKNRKTK